MYDNSLALMGSLRDAGIDYRSDTPIDDENLVDTVRVGWEGAHLPATTILLRVNDRGAHLEVENLGCVAPGLRAQALELVNALNGAYRWVTFVLEDDGRLSCSSDVFLVPEVAGLFGMAAMGRMFDTLDEVYPRVRAVLC
ncbi:MULTISPECIES: YbjN domain-containing protein [unclassified Collinsella]|uniref:YbjN domain-containing protein n=1 Tax=unclassified Collinsella TaxID=2637548 RepID=UPI0011CB12FD|nr:MULTISPECIES: YbjN domain-containing protein [unclassified Collinsella]TXF35937.1 hypothetical protein E4J93_06095 [Collinsella sp. BA40]